MSEFLKVADLIGLLQRCPQDAHIILEYDTLCCYEKIGPKQVRIVGEDSPYEAGVWLLTSDRDYIRDYNRDSDFRARCVPPGVSR